MFTTDGLPFILEDRTGSLHQSDFDDIYDRLFLRVARQPQPQGGDSSATKQVSYAIYDMGRRSSSGPEDRRHLRVMPAIVLAFAPSGGLGTVTFVREGVTVRMQHYLRKTSFVGSSRTRKFKGSDGQSYLWRHKLLPEHEWTCTNAEDEVVAHYNLKPKDKPAFGVSGNVLTVHEAFVHLSTEILATLCIMRYIDKHRL